MAQEITASAFLSVLKNGVTDSVSGSGAFTQSGDLFTHQILTCMDEDQELDLGNLSSASGSFLFIRSLIGNTGALYLDSDEISSMSDAALSLSPGEFFLGRWNGAAIHVFAVAGQLLEYLLIEN